MPQMYPLLWLILMVMVMVVYGLLNILNYFILQSSKASEERVSHQTNFKNWQW